MKTRTISAALAATLVAVMTLLAAAPAAADAVRKQQINAPVCVKVASGFSISISGDNLKRTGDLSLESWWGYDSSWNRYAYTLNNPLIFVDPDGREVTYADARDQQFYEGAAARNWRVRRTLDAFGPGSGRDLHVERGTPRPHPQGIPVLANTEVNISQESDTQGMIDAYDAAGGGEAGEAAALAVPPLLGEVTSATITLGPNPTGHTRLHELGHVNQALGNPSEYLEQQQDASQATTHAAYQGTESERYANGYARDARRNDPVPPGE